MPWHTLHSARVSACSSGHGLRGYLLGVYSSDFGFRVDRLEWFSDLSSGFLSFRILGSEFRMLSGFMNLGFQGAGLGSFFVYQFWVHWVLG